METFFEKILSAKPTVLEVLKTNLEARDDDNVLILAVWEIQAGKDIVSYYQFKLMLLTGGLSTPETITRSRRKLQEDNVELRGKLYDERQKQEKIVRNQMKLDF